MKRVSIGRGWDLFEERLREFPIIKSLNNITMDNFVRVEKAINIYTDITKDRKRWINNHQIGPRIYLSCKL